MEKSAVLSECGRYRYALTRKWDNDLPELCFIMLNPSTAGSYQDDPTIRRCLRFAQDMGYGRLDVVNLFALRATDPCRLESTPNPIGLHNNTWILNHARAAQDVICAWGTRGMLFNRGIDVERLLKNAGVRLSALRITKNGEPAHPLYLPASLRPILF